MLHLVDKICVAEYFPNVYVNVGQQTEQLIDFADVGPSVPVRRHHDGKAAVQMHPFTCTIYKFEVKS